MKDYHPPAAVTWTWRMQNRRVKGRRKQKKRATSGSPGFMICQRSRRSASGGLLDISRIRRAVSTGAAPAPAGADRKTLPRLIDASVILRLRSL